MAEIIEFNAEKRGQQADAHTRRYDRIMRTARDAVEAITESLDGVKLTREHAVDLAVLTQSLSELFLMAADEIDTRG